METASSSCACRATAARTQGACSSDDTDEGSADAARGVGKVEVGKAVGLAEAVAVEALGSSLLAPSPPSAPPSPSV
eukprot:2577206-Pleurochrysis_carterae.AAC.1